MGNVHLYLIHSTLPHPPFHSGSRTICSGCGVMRNFEARLLAKGTGNTIVGPIGTSAAQRDAVYRSQSNLNSRIQQINDAFSNQKYDEIYGLCGTSGAICPYCKTIQPWSVYKPKVKLSAHIQWILLMLVIALVSYTLTFVIFSDLIIDNTLWVIPMIGIPLALCIAIGFYRPIRDTKKRADERTVIEAELKDIIPPVIRWITPQNPQEM